MGGRRIMSPQTLLSRLRAAGVEVVANGDRLRWRAPTGTLTAADRLALQEHKPAILQLLASGSSTKDGTVPRSTAPVFLDLETRSLCDLKGAGGRRYARHPSTAILSTVALFDGRITVWCPQAEAAPAVAWPEGWGVPWPIDVFISSVLPLPLGNAIAAGRPFVAHNASGFERFVWAAKGLPQPVGWVDTLLEARAMGLPGKLDDLAKRLFGIGKD